MFDFIKNILKKQNEHFYELSDEVYKNKKIICYYDLYFSTNIIKDIELMVNSSEFKKYHYKNIQANQKTIEKLDKIICWNLCNTRNKYKRCYDKKYLESMAAMDSLQWAPKVNNDLKDDLIRVVLPNNKEYTVVKKGDI